MAEAAQKTREPRSGELRVGLWSEYEPGQPGYVIERCQYLGPSFDMRLGWAIPAWDECGEPQFEGVFPTYAAAARVLAEA